MRKQDEQSSSTLNPQTERKIYQGSIQPKGFPSIPPNWVSEWETFPSSDGKLQLFSSLHRREPWSGPRLLVILHGMGEHGGRYLHFPHYLQNTVDAVCCLDHRGHGRSEGLRGHVDSFDLLADDAALAISRIDHMLKKRFGRSEIHLLGHSMGGLVALRALIKHHLPLASAAVSAPLLGIKVHTPVVKKYAGILLSRLWGSLHMSTELDANVLSHDPDVVEAYTSDRLVHNKITPKFFTELTGAMRDTLKRPSELMTPLQLILPLSDQVVDSEVSLEFFQRLNLKDQQLKTYPSFFHESFNEIGKEQVFEDFSAWIKNHSKA